MAETTEAEQADSKTEAQSVEYSEVNAIGDAGAGGSIDLLLDVCWR